MANLNLYKIVFHTKNNLWPTDTQFAIEILDQRKSVTWVFLLFFSFYEKLLNKQNIYMWSVFNQLSFTFHFTLCFFVHFSLLMRQNDTFVWGFSMLIKILLIPVMYIRFVDVFFFFGFSDKRWKDFSFYFLIKCNRGKWKWYICIVKTK